MAVMGYNLGELAKTYEAGTSRRVSHALLADSNTRYNPAETNASLKAITYGFNVGFQKAIRQLFGVYATPPFGAMAVGNLTMDEYCLGLTGNGTVPTITDADASAYLTDNFRIPPDSYGGSSNQGCPRAHMYDSTNTTHYNAGSCQSSTGRDRWWHMRGDFLLDRTKGLRWHFQRGNLASGSSGTRQAPTCWRYQDGVTSENIASKNIATVTGTDEIVQDYLDWPATAFDDDDILYLSWGRLSSLGGGSNQGFLGPMYIGWNQIEDTTASTGFCPGYFYHMGGRSAYHTAAQLTDPDSNFTGYDIDAAHAEYLRQLVRLQSGDPKLIAVMFFSGNTYGGGAPSTNSLGPNPAASNTTAGEVDNMRAVETKLRDLWVNDLGYNDSDLRFVAGTYQRWADSGDNSFEDACDALADEFSGDSYNSGVFVSRRRTYQEIADNGLGQTSISTVHLDPAGYDALAADYFDIIRSASDADATPGSVIGRVKTTGSMLSKTKPVQGFF